MSKRDDVYAIAATCDIDTGLRMLYRAVYELDAEDSTGHIERALDTFAAKAVRLAKRSVRKEYIEDLNLDHWMEGTR